MKKVLQAFYMQIRERGLFIALWMCFSHFRAWLRGLFYKLLYVRNIRSSFLAMQSNSSIEIFHKRARLRFGRFVFIRKNVSIRLDEDGVLLLGDKVFINDHCTINCIHKITIGDHTKIAPNVCINDHDHNYKGVGEEHLLKGEVIIGRNVWIGSNAVILRNTIIGDNAVIAAGSVVKGEVPANTMYVNKREKTLIEYAPPKPEATKAPKKQVIVSMYDMEIGGIERSLINMLESFDYEQYDVDLLVCRHMGEFMGLIPQQVNILPEMNQYTVFRKSMLECLREGRIMTCFIRFLSLLVAKLMARLHHLQEGHGYIQMQLVSKYSAYILPSLNKSYDLAISYAWPHDIIAKKVQAKRTIAWIHTDYSKLEIDKRMDLKVWKRYDYIASISDGCTKAFLSSFPSLQDKIVHIENITSPEMIYKMTEQVESLDELDENAFKIVSVGRLSYVKGFDLAIQALKKLHDRGLTHIKWYVVGFGGLESELKRMIRQYDLEGSFFLLGKKSNPYPYIQACDLYVHPSRYEGKAVTVTEAQILNKPIVITNYPTASSQVEDGVDGVICPLSVDGITDAIEEMVHNQTLRQQMIRNVKARDYRNHYELNKLYQIIV